MADTVKKTIEVLFNGVDKVSGVVKDIEGNINDLGSGMSDIGAPFAAATGAVFALDAALAALIVTAVSVSSSIESESKKMQASLGLTTEEVQRFEDIAKTVYSQGYGDDLAESFDAVVTAQKKFGDSAETDIGKAVESALKLQNIFGVEYSASLAAAKTLMTNFGVSADEAFDFIALGYQKGLDGAGDFLDSINEYSTQFSNGGASANEFFSVLETGFQEGMLGTDRAADAFKEFRVRIQDGSKLTKESLESIGIDNEALQKNLQEGKMTVADAFALIIKTLGETEDKSLQMQAGVGLIGTQFEDLGTNAALSLDLTKTKMDDIVGTMENMDTDTFEKSLTSAWRSAVTAIGSLEIWDDLKEQIGENATAIAEQFETVLKTYDFSELEAVGKDIWDTIAGFFQQADLDLTTTEGMKNAVDLAVGSIESLLTVTKGLVEVFGPVALQIKDVADYFNDLDSDTKELVGNILAFGTALTTIGGLVAVGGTIIGGLSTLLALISGPVGLTVALGALGVAAIAAFSDFEPIPDEYFTKPHDLLNDFKDDIELFPKELQTKINLAVEEGAEVGEVLSLIEGGIEDLYVNVDVESTGIDDIQEELYDIPEEKPVMVMVDGEYVELDDLEERLDDLDSAEVEIDTEVNQSSLDDATETISYWVDGIEYTIEVPVEATEIEEVKKEIEEIPTEKMLEIKLQGDIDKEIAMIETSAKTAQEAFKYTAEVDIAQIEAQAEIIQATFESVNTSIASTGDTILGALDKIDSSDFQTKWAALDVLKEEQELREKSFALQEKLISAQIKALEAESEEEKTYTINIDSTGLEPELEMILWQIIEKVQIKASETGANFLLGVG